MFIVIFNILIYIFFALAMSNIAKRSYASYGEFEGLDRYEKNFIIFYVLLVALSYGTGVDAGGYLWRFLKGFKPDEGNTEYIYNGITNFIAQYKIPFYFGMGLIGFGQMYPLVKALEKQRYILIMLPIVFFGNCYFLAYMNAMRQMIVASIFFFSCSYIKEKKYLLYLITIFLCSYIHHSALMLLPFILLAFTDKWLDIILQKRNILIITYIVCIILGLTPSFQNVISYAQDISELSGYDNYTERVGEFLNGKYNNEAHNYGPMMISYMAIGFFVIWFCPVILEKYKEKIPCLNIWLFLAVAYGCIYFLIVNVSHIFIRPVMYLLPFQLVIVSLILWYLYYEVQRKNISWLLIAVIWVECCWNLIKNPQPWSSSNYHLSLFYGPFAIF